MTRARFLACLLLAASPAAANTLQFGVRTDLAVGSLPRSLALADLDHDQKLDLVVTCEGGAFAQVFRGHGDGTFAAPLPVATDDGPRALPVADRKRDGILDLQFNGN
jgi:hypothetical protein